MAFSDRAQESTTTTGTGTYDLDGATSSHETIVAGIGTGNSADFVVTDGVDWEVFTGTVTSGTPDTLTRDTILSSSNADAAVSWTSGTKTVSLGVSANWLTSPSVTNLTSSGEVRTSTIDSNGTGDISFQTDGGEQFRVVHTASASRYVSITGSNGGSPTIQTAGGSAGLNIYTNTPNRVDIGDTTNGSNVSIFRSGSDVYIEPGNGTFHLRTASTGDNLTVENSAGAEVAVFDTTASAVNHFELESAITTNNPRLQAIGDDTNIGMELDTKGTGDFIFQTNAGADEQFRIVHTASASNYLSATGSNGGSPRLTTSGGGIDLYSGINGGIVALGDDTNGDSFSVYHSGGNVYQRAENGSTIDQASSTTANHQFQNSANAISYLIQHQASSVNYVRAVPTTAGNPPYFETQGTDTNAGMQFLTKGTGGIVFRTNAGSQYQVNINHTASSVNTLELTGSAAGNDIPIGVAGTDSDIGIDLQTKGAGRIFADASPVWRGDVTTGISAAGTTQGAATALTTTVNEVTTATAASAEGVVLPATPEVGDVVIVINNDGTDTIKIYPGTGDSLDTLSANTSVDLATGNSRTFVATTASQWYTVATAALS